MNDTYYPEISSFFSYAALKRMLPLPNYSWSTAPVSVLRTPSSKGDLEIPHSQLEKQIVRCFPATGYFVCHVYKLDHPFIIQGSNSGIATWKRCTGQGMGNVGAELPSSLGVYFSARTDSLCPPVQKHAKPRPVGGLWKLH